jgi:hypothetical protein
VYFAKKFNMDYKITAFIMLLILILANFSCAQNPSKKNDCAPAAKKILERDATEVVESSDGSKTLYIYRSPVSPEQPQAMVKYVVLSKIDCKELKKGEFFNGKIYWLDAKTLEYYSVPGMMRKDQTLDDLKQKIVLE